MSGLIKKKQVLGLLEDLTSLQHGLPILKRSTVYSGLPAVAEAVLNTDSAQNVTQLLINVKDDVIGNSYSQLNEISINDKLIIKNQNTDTLSVYLITGITSEVNSSYEGYFILTIQHSFGYDSTLSSGELVYYFRRVASSSIYDSIADESARAVAAEESLNALIAGLSISIESTIELIYDEKARAFAAEARLEGQMLGLIQSVGAVNKYTEEVFIGGSDMVTINHNLGTEYVTVQAFDSSGVYNFNINVMSQDVNNVNISRQSTMNPNDPGDTYKIIIIG